MICCIIVHNYAVDSDASAQWLKVAERLSSLHPLSEWLPRQPRVLCLQ